MKVNNIAYTNSISIHALLAESDYLCPVQPSAVVVFLSTLSLRRATTSDFSNGDDQLIISIHALLAESDRPTLYPLHRQQHFYPRSPCGERRPKWPKHQQETLISIHALLAESDGRNGQNIKRRHKFLSTLSLRRATCQKYINRRPNHVISIHALLAESDSVISSAGTTGKSISIHALLAESDRTQSASLFA